MNDTPRSIAIFLPSFGASIEEGTIVNWRVSVGDTVRAGQVIADVETDKALVELGATDDGVVSAIEVPEGGGPVKVGTTIARLEAPGAEVDPQSGALEPAAAPEATPLEASESAPGVAREDRRPVDRHGDAPTTQSKGPIVSDDSGPARIRASPRARRLARECGLRVQNISGSGPNGRVVGGDLEPGPDGAVRPVVVGPGDPQASASQRPTVSPALSGLGIAPGSYDLTPLTGMRKTIARRLSESFRDVPHFSLSVDIELDGMLQQRRAFNESHVEAGVGLSINDFVIWAAAAALKDVPEANASYTDEGIARHHHADIAVAVAVEGGLLTPVVRAAESKSVREIAAELRQLVERARARRLERADFEGGTFTVSNLGSFGIKSFSSVLNPPQACILSVGSAERRPVFRNSGYSIATLATMTLTCDHRVVDGVIGARFLSAFRTHIVTPPAIATA